jgi:hypothetical protein
VKFSRFLGHDGALSLKLGLSTTLSCDSYKEADFVCRPISN